MPTRKRTFWTLFIISFITLPFLLSPLLTQSQNSNKEEKAKVNKKVNPLDFPMTDFPDTPARDPKEQKKREGKGEKYNRPETAIDERLVTVADTYHWDANLPPLPVKESDAVIVGKVTAAEAHLSSNKTGIYSEFTIEIQQILKNDSESPLVVPGFVVAERTGGRVRFPSGQVSLMYVSNLGMPQPGKTYVLFLTHNFLYQVRRNEDYRVLTGYELLDGRVVPLDSTRVVNFDVHRGKDEHTFIDELEAMTDCVF